MGVFRFALICAIFFWLFLYKPDKDSARKDEYVIVPQGSTHHLWEESLRQLREEQAALSDKMAQERDERMKTYNRGGYGYYGE